VVQSPDVFPHVLDKEFNFADVVDGRVFFAEALYAEFGFAG
jgi:hypothetical protein